jgi:hypothetical protein
MAWSAVYLTATSELFSVGTFVDLAAVPPELTVVPTSFSDGVTPDGSKPDLGVVVWNPATHRFDPKPPRVKDSEEQGIDVILAKANNQWDTSDIARALKALLRKIVVRAD